MRPLSLSILAVLAVLTGTAPLAADPNKVYNASDIPLVVSAKASAAGGPQVPCLWFAGVEPDSGEWVAAFETGPWTLDECKHWHFLLEGGAGASRVLQVGDRAGGKLGELQLFNEEVQSEQGPVTRTRIRFTGVQGSPERLVNLNSPGETVMFIREGLDSGSSGRETMDSSVD